MTDKHTDRPKDTEESIAKKNQENDPMFVDKKLPEMEEYTGTDDLFVANAHDSRVNSLDGLSYEDHQQTFGSTPQTPEQAARAKEAAMRAAEASTDKKD